MVSKLKLTQKNTMLIRKECDVKKELDNKYVFRRKIFLHKEHSDQNGFKKRQISQVCSSGQP